MSKKHKTVVGERIVTPKGRLSFPHLKDRNSGGEYPSDKYEATILIPKSADVSPLLDAALKVAKTAFNGKVTKMEDLAFNPIRDGDEKELDGYADHWYIKAKSSYRPGVVDKERNPVDDLDEVRAGDYVRLSLKPLSYMQGGRPGVTFTLQNVQYLGQGERFGGGTKAEDDFDVYADEGVTADDL